MTATSDIKQTAGSIVSGGAAQQLLAAKESRVGFWIQNTSAGDLWILDGGNAAAASPSLKIPPNALYETTPGDWLRNAYSIFGATTGQTFTLKEW